MSKEQYLHNIIIDFNNWSSSVPSSSVLVDDFLNINRSTNDEKLS